MTGTKSVRQTGPHLAYVITSLLGVVFDILVLFSAVLVVIGVLLLAFTLLLPVFTFMLAGVSDPLPSGIQAFVTDLRALNGGTIVRMAIMLPPIIFVLIRQKIARPFRRRRDLAFGFILSLPANIIMVDLIAFAFGLYPFGQSGSYYIFEAFNTISSQFETGTLPQTALTYIMMSGLLAGFLYLPYLLIYLIWKRRLGPLQRTSGTANQRPKGSMRGFITAFVSHPDTHKALLFTVLACAFASASVAVLGVNLPSVVEEWIVDSARNAQFASEEIFVRTIGLSALLFWSAVLSVLACILYICLLRPRLIKLLLFGAVIPLLTLLAFQIRAVSDGAFAHLWLMLCVVFAVWAIPFFGLLYAGLKSFQRSIGLAHKSAIKSSLTDRPTILLLRCFALDQALVKRSGHVVGVFDIFRLFLTRLEEVIVREAYLTAPVRAVANPGETQEPLGAVREYLSDDDWQPFVSNQISASQSIIFILGRGNYTGWETQKIIDSGALGRVVFIVPPDPKPALDYLAQNPQVAEALGPEAIKAIKSGRVRGFVTGQDETTLVTNSMKTELAYQLATRRLLVAVQPVA